MDVTHSKIASFYRDERTLQYFFVCHQCEGCYETITEIIEHAENRCRKNSKRKRSSVEIIDVEPNLQSEQNSTSLNNNNCTAMDLVAKKDLVGRLVAADKNYTSAKGTATIHILSNERITGPSIIDISDEESIEKLPKAQQLQNSSVSSRSKIIEDTTIVDISDDEFIAEPTKTPIINIFDGDTIEKLPLAGQTTCEENRARKVKDNKIVVISDDEIMTQPSVTPIIGKFVEENNMNLNITLSSCENHLIEHVNQKTSTPAEDITSEKQIDQFRSYFCQICSFKFLNQNDFARHLENHRAYYKCITCNEFLETPARLTTHMMQKHNKVTKPECKYCGRIFKGFSSLETHLFDSHKDAISILKLPINVKVRPEIYQCDYCCREFYVKKGLKRHLLTTHLKSNHNQRGLNYKINFNTLDGTRINPDISEWDEGILVKNFDTFLDSVVIVSSTGEQCSVDYFCNICEFKSNEIMNAALHICQIHKEHLYQVAVNKFHEVDNTDNWNLPFNNPIVCKFCTKIFTKKFGDEGIYQHILQVHNEISCNRCSLTFKEYHQFHAHYIEHYRARSKDESAAENLSKFIKEKTIFDEYHQLPYLCLICGKRHINMDKMSEHVRTHICTISKVRIVKVSRIFKPLPSDQK